MSEHRTFFVPDLSAVGGGTPSAEQAPERPSEKHQHKCIRCGVLSPPAETGYTLISARSGWRLHRFLDPRTGHTHMEWRCPDCWEIFRGRKPHSGARAHGGHTYGVTQGELPPDAQHQGAQYQGAPPAEESGSGGSWATDASEWTHSRSGTYRRDEITRIQRRAEPEPSAAGGRGRGKR